MFQIFSTHNTLISLFFLIQQYIELGTESLNKIKCDPTVKTINYTSYFQILINYIINYHIINLLTNKNCKINTFNNVWYMNKTKIYQLNIYQWDNHTCLHLIRYSILNKNKIIHMSNDCFKCLKLLLWT